MSQGKIIFRSADQLYDIEAPSVMGIINVTPDSFYSSSRMQTLSEVIDTAGQMRDDGVSILDIGAASTRPGSNQPPIQQELDRLMPALQTLKQYFPDLLFSIDTFHAEVARCALESGAHIINDISAGKFDSEIWKVCAENFAPYILMHMQGIPLNMQSDPTYNDVTEEVFDFISAKIIQCKSAGIHDIWIDPGFGFGKTMAHNYTLLKELEVFKMHNRPVVVGISRKGMIHRLLQIQPEASLCATSALHLQALLKGADILRVHDVREAVQMIRLYHELKP